MLSLAGSVPQKLCNFEQQAAFAASPDCVKVDHACPNVVSRKGSAPLAVQNGFNY